MKSLIGSQSFPWWQHYNRMGKDVAEHLDETLAQVKAAGLQAWEGGFTTEEQALQLRDLLKKHDLVMPSMYVGGRFHEGDIAGIIKSRMLLAGWAHKYLGTKVIVCNPEPDSKEKNPKTDAQLRKQAESVNELARQLAAIGMKFAYHTHAPEMRCGAREFHHTLLGTDPALVGLCLDTHWIYRGCENSQVALEDITMLYGSRIASLHVRQSQKGIWTEYLQEGDIDFRPVAACLKAHKFSGPIIIETAFEEGTPHLLTMTESHRRSREWLESQLK